MTGPIVSGLAADLCADIRDGTASAPASGAPMQAWQCHGGANQQFTLQANGSITAYGGALCLDVSGGQANDGDPVIAGPCQGSTDQRWTYTSAGQLQTAVNGKCLDLWGAQAQNGALLVVWPCDGGSNQMWTFANAPAAIGTAELPRVYLNTAMPTPTGQSIPVASGGDLQAALDAAQPGDEVLLAPGASYVGNYVLSAKAGMGDAQWITVRTAGALPAEGTRVGPGDAAQLPKILTPNAAAAVATVPGAQGWRFTGVEIGAAPGVTMTYTLVSFGDVGANQTTLAQVPSRLVLDRSYIHGSPTLDVRRCVALNSANSAVIDSYLTECHSRNGDSQAINGWNGPGPFKIVNNHLEGGHENIGFGGGDPSVQGLIPSDIEIRRNHVIKPLAWKGVWTAKNLLEIKAGQRVLIEGNVFENNWVDGQNGFAFIWWSVNQEGGCTWCTTQDVTFRYNRVTNVAGGFNLADKYYATTSPPMQRVTIAHNVITGLDGSNGRLYQVSGALAGVTIANNSGLGVVHDLTFATPDQPLPDLVFQNNVTGGQYTLFSSQGSGAAALSILQIPAANVTGNVFASGSGAGVVPSGNAYAASVDAIGFVNFAGGDLTLAPSSAFLNSGTGGSRPGADVPTVLSKTQGVVQ